MNPTKNIYPCNPYFCKEKGEPYYEYDPEFALAAAIYYVQQDRVKELLETMTEEEVLAVTLTPLPPYSKVDNYNVLEKICITQSSVRYHISEPTSIYEWAQADNYRVSKALYQIVRLLLEKTTKLLTPKCFEFAHVLGKEDLIKLMMKYEDADAETSCYICISGALPQEQFTNICKCKAPIHKMCLEKVLKTTGRTCRTCRAPFILNEKRVHMGRQLDTRIFSPFDDFYPQMFSLRKYTSRKDKPLSEKLYWAVCYLQLGRAADILDKMSSTEFRRYILNIAKGTEHNSPFKTVKFDKDGEIEKLELMDNMPQNYRWEGNEQVMAQIEMCLNDKAATTRGFTVCR